MEYNEIAQPGIVGKKTRRNIFGSNGVLLIPEYTTITYDHALKLHNHGIELSEDDVFDDREPEREASFQPLVDDMVSRVDELFTEVRMTGKIPFSELKNDILPVMKSVAKESRLFSLFASLQAKDDYIYRHNVAVGVISCLMGRWLKLGEEAAAHLLTAGLMHDIGKMMIPEALLNKPGPLTEQEFEEMKRHTIYGYELMKSTPGIHPREALVALQHHERMDGSGYPFGETGDSIDLFSRIVMVADMFHAMTSKRVYREPASIHETLSEIRKYSFGKFDPKVTQVFLKEITKRLQGCRAELSDGRTGVIVLMSPQDPLRPLVKIGDKFIDLAKHSSLQLRKVW